MNQQERFRLHFGPYRTPRFRYGAIVQDAVRGPVRIVSMTDARIPWPVGWSPINRGRPSLVVYKGLAKATRREANQAVAHWWGVTPQTVSKWRNFLAVMPTTPGTSRLRRAYAFTEPVQRGLRKLQTKSRDAAHDAPRRAKIAAAKLGKKRPATVVAALRKALLGRRLTKKTRRKMSEVHRQRGSRPPWINPPWMPEDEDLLRTLPAAEVARRGRTLTAVYSRRSQIGLPDGRRRRSDGPRDDEKGA